MTVAGHPLHGPGFLTDSMRIDEDDLAVLDWETLPDIITGITNRRTRAFLKGLKGVLDP